MSRLVTCNLTSVLSKESHKKYNQGVIFVSELLDLQQ